MAEDSFRSEGIISQSLDGSFIEISILGDIGTNKPDHSPTVPSTPLKPARKPREKNCVYPFQCDTFLKDFKYISSVLTGMHDSIQVTTHVPDAESASLTSHKEKKHSSLFVCPVCGKIFTNNRSDRQCIITNEVI